LVALIFFVPLGFFFLSFYLSSFFGSTGL
jgi:hypothetical protein